jgi:repressor LexA
MARFEKLTKRQQAIYDFIRDLIFRRGYGPTVREIAGQFDIKSPNGVMCHLRALERKGLIRRDANKARTDS